MIFATNATAMAVTSALARLVVGRTGPTPLRLIGVLLSAASSVGRRYWAGLTPRHRESDTTVHRGRITKQGSRPVRRAAVEAVQRVSGTYAIRSARSGAATSGAVAPPVEVIFLVFYGQRDHHIRCLPAHTAAGMSNPGPRRARIVQLMTPAARGVVALLIHPAHREPRRSTPCRPAAVKG